MLEMIKACAVIVLFLGCVSLLATFVAGAVGSDFQPAIQINLN
jgi:flagellar biosynthesis protein FliQ